MVWPIDHLPMFRSDVSATAPTFPQPVLRSPGVGDAISVAAAEAPPIGFMEEEDCRDSEMQGHEFVAAHTLDVGRGGRQHQLLETEAGTSLS